MVTPSDQSVEALVTALKAAAEPTRLRILALLAQGELNVKDLTQVLNQSQPRISRHLKLLTEAGLIERFRDGSWVYFHISDRHPGGRLALRLIADVDPTDMQLRRDRDRADVMKRDRDSSAQTFFETHAADWDRMRSLHVAEHAVEAAMVEALGAGPFQFLVDLGTGTGRTLELFASRYQRGLGIDANQSMLAYAQAKLKRSATAHAQVRHGDLYTLALADQQADAIVMHQVLHVLSDPAQAVREAARVLAPGGRLLIVDFAPHDLEFLREQEAHERLGFSHEQVSQWLRDSGLEVSAVRDLKPKDTGAAGQLTVTLWLGERPAAPTKSKTHNALDRSAIAYEEAR